MKKLLIGATLALASMAAHAQFTTDTWGNCVNNTVNAPSTSDFDTCELTFDPIQSSQLISINNPGSGYYHNHSEDSAVHSLDVLLNGSWTPIFTHVAPGNEDISAISTPIDFAAGTVTGVRFTVDTEISQGYHSVDSAMSFTFNTVQPVPTMSEWALIILAMSVAGVGVYSQRRRFNHTA
ncbi:MAG: IPTL-CTERM sorting domain-containing protein [bacterium]